jgi:hypothetical protein
MRYARALFFEHRFPSSRWASAIQIVRPSIFKAETQTKLQPAALSLSAMISQSFTVSLLIVQHRFRRVCSLQAVRSPRQLRHTFFDQIAFNLPVPQR